MAVFALIATISFLFIRKPFVPNGRLFDSCHLAAESLYFTDSVLGQSLLDQRYQGQSILGLGKKQASRETDKMREANLVGSVKSNPQTKISTRNSLKHVLNN